MGARTAAARAEVVARRQLLLDEVVRLEAAGRSAIDIPAKIRHSPAKVAALAAGTAFMILGGPKKSYNLVRRRVFGPTADLPKSMLPEQIDKALRALGNDGNRVRGVIEREFVDYLEKNKPVRDARDLRGTVSELGGNILRPVTAQVGRRLATELMSPETGTFNSVMDRIRRRREERGTSGVDASADTSGGASGSAPESVASGSVTSKRPSRWERRQARDRKG